MTARLARLTLLALTILALLLPRVSAAVTLVAPGARFVVICTGAGLETLLVDEAGVAVPLPPEAGHGPDHCILAHAADTAVRVAPEPSKAPLVGLVARQPRDLVAGGGFAEAPPPSRAPPAA